MNKPKLLWISYRAPYMGVPHAGGKIHDFYIKGLQKISNFEILLLTYAYSDEISKVDTTKCGINTILIERPINGFKHIKYAIINRLHNMNVFAADGGYNQQFIRNSLVKNIKRLKKSGYKPDIIILHWTQISLNIEYIKSEFKHAPVVTIEEDVSFQALERKFLFENRYPLKWFKKFKYNQLKKSEIAALNQADMIILNNPKDRRLLKESGVDVPKWDWAPFFVNHCNVKYRGGTNDILYFGAMDREENWRSAIWFIEKVLVLLSDYNIRFIIIGSRPHKELLRYSSDRVVIKGYVEDPDLYFQEGLCFVAPLVMGAGIKIKVLEAMSYGIPVLTNTIGIEGIDAEDGKEFILCNEPEEYAKMIVELIDNNINILQMSHSEKEFIIRNYDYEKDLMMFNESLLNLL